MLEGFGSSSLRQLGELEIIRIIERFLGTNPRTVVGFGDDVSSVRLAKHQVVVLKTDMLVGSTDVPPGMSMRQTARKAVVANVSDLAAKGARPIAGVVALGLPSTLTKKDVMEIAAGLGECAKEYGFSLVGGDTNESNDLVISIALFALMDERRMVLRSGARVGDIVAVTGAFGNASAGLKALLERRLRPDKLPRALANAVYRPRAELELGVRLASSGVVNASIDSSDGLAWSLHELSKASKVGIQVQHVPTSKAAKHFASNYGYNATDLALYGGEEYNLIVTVRPSQFRFAQRAARGSLKPIGVVTPKSRGVRFVKDEHEFKVAMKGWEHFRQRK